MNPCPKPKTERDKKYLAFIRKFPCMICGKVPSEAHHENNGTGGMGMKASDYAALPLCTSCHYERHQFGKSFLEGIDIPGWQARLRRVYELKKGE